MILTNTTREGHFGRHNNDFCMGDFYHRYMIANKTSTLTQKRFTTIWKEYIDKVMQKVIHEKYDFKMQAQMGSVYIISKRIDFKFDDDGDLIRKGFRIDWNATRKMWQEDQRTHDIGQVIYHFNEHSSRRNFRYYWDKRLCKVLNQTFYMFYPCRKWKRELAKWIKSEDFDTIYYEVK